MRLSVDMLSSVGENRDGKSSAVVSGPIWLVDSSVAVKSASSEGRTNSADCENVISGSGSWLTSMA